MRLWNEISGGKPFCLKGIQGVEDSKRAVEIGCQGIVVSNHAGRQVDRAVASLDALEQIVDGEPTFQLCKTYLVALINWISRWRRNLHNVFDSGVRGASNVFKALALGAKFVFVGRLWVWRLSVMGETGVRHVLKSLLADFDILLNVAGYKDVSEIDRAALGELHTS